LLRPIDELDNILAELRKEHRKVQPPAFPAARLQAEAASALVRSKWLRLSWPFAAALVAFVILMLGKPGVRVDDLRPNRNDLAPQTRVERAPDSALAAVVARTPATSPARKPRTSRKDEEAMTEFIDLPGTATLPVSAETSILRVQLAKGDLRQYGFDVPPQVAAEIVRADFIVGNDGMARAIRLIR
jgi:hypothetical protein